MKIAAITMVYRDYWALAQWYRHYGRHLGHKHLYIIAHGEDPHLDQLCPRAQIVTVPRDSLDGFDAYRGKVLNQLRFGLLTMYDWVIQTDADELICLDPDHHRSFATLFQAQTAPALFALGMNVVERPGDPKLHKRSAVLNRRGTAVFSGHYSKAWASRIPLGFARHGIKLSARRAAKRPLTLPRGVYLAHLKYANLAALKSANHIRTRISHAPGDHLPGHAWQKPWLQAKTYLARVDVMPDTPWDQAEPAAHARLIAQPHRDPDRGLLRAENIAFDQRVTLPDRIRQF